MNVLVTQKLTRHGIQEILSSKTDAPLNAPHGDEHRRHPRWFIDGSVDFWAAEGNWQEPWSGQCCNISEGGLGMRSSHYLEPGTTVGLVIHLPEDSFHGTAVVRYCQHVRDNYMTGLEFQFDE